MDLGSFTAISTSVNITGSRGAVVGYLASSTDYGGFTATSCVKSITP